MVTGVQKTRGLKNRRSFVSGMRRMSGINVEMCNLKAEIDIFQNLNHDRAFEPQFYD